VPEFEPGVNYYQLYWKAFVENNLLLDDLRNQSEERNSHFQNLIKMNNSQYSQSKGEERKENRKKHNRRCAKEIRKSELCPYPDCGKYYGSEGSLNLHMKLKHQGGNKTDREKLAKTMVLCFANNKPYPEITINLPPGSIIEEVRKMNMEMSPKTAQELEEVVSTKFKNWANKI